MRRLIHGIVFILSGFIWQPGVLFAVDNVMILIPDGKFTLGSSEKDGKVGLSIGVDEIPAQDVFLKAFFIDEYEVTNRQYKDFLESSGYSSGNRVDEDIVLEKEYFSPANFADQPVTNVSWFDSDAYCRWAGKRLSDEMEWEKAARGKDARQWPWGNDFREDACNVKYTGAGEILPAGSMDGDISPYGVRDMCGNVSEWTSSWYKPYQGSTLRREAFGEKFKVARGGSWVMPAFPYSRISYRSNVYDPKYRHRGIGFRCAKDAE